MTTDIAMAVGCFNIQVEPKSAQRNCIIYRTWFNYRSYPPLLLASLPPPPKEMDHSTSQESKGIWVAFGFELLGTDSLIIIHTDTSCFSRRYIKLPWWVAAKGKRKNIEKGSDSDQTGLGPGAAWGVHTVKGCSSLSYFQLHVSPRDASQSTGTIQELFNEDIFSKQIYSLELFSEIFHHQQIFTYYVMVLHIMPCK